MEIFELSMPLWKLLARATLIYFALAIVLRLLPKREIGGISPSDLLALVIMGGLVADSMSAGAENPLDFVVLAAVVLGWSWLINMLEFRSPLFARWTVEAPVVIVREGEMLRRAMRQELVTELELLSQLRLAGLEGVEEAALVTVEPNGQLSVIAKSTGH